MESFFEEMREEVSQIGYKNKELAQKDKTKFYTGKIILTDGVRKLIHGSEPIILLGDCLKRYADGDFGQVKNAEDLKMNHKSIETGYGDVMGGYIINGNKIWFKTDLCENTITTIFLPSEY